MVKRMDIEDKEKNVNVSRENRRLTHKGKQFVLTSDFKKAHLNVEQNGITFSKGLRKQLPDFK